MKITPLEIEGLKLIELDVRRDHRGFFVERFNAEKFKALGLDREWVQDNHSWSHPGVIRGLHYQYGPPQGKLVGCIRGRVWDVALDLRAGSPTYGKHFGIELSGENGLMLWMPAGFAHGFCVMGDEPADVLYKVDAPYGPTGEGGIRWSDPDAAIKWPVAKPIVSERDDRLPGLAEYRKAPKF